MDGGVLNSVWRNCNHHSHRMWTEVSSFVLHLLHKALLIIRIKWRCLPRVLCLIRSPVTSLDCVLFKYNNLVFVVELGPELSFWACLWILLGPRHIAKCWLSTQHSSFFFMFCIETPKDGSSPTIFLTEPSVASLSAILLPCTPACPGTQ